jgi:hypothetical protein
MVMPTERDVKNSITTIIIIIVDIAANTNRANMD